MKHAGMMDSRISTHALREEGDVTSPRITYGLYISTHALREEGDLAGVQQERPHRHISTHALREEGDRIPVVQRNNPCRFLPTPSARRATAFPSTYGLTYDISTHALREEGDRCRVYFLGPLLISTHALREEGDG